MKISLIFYDILYGKMTVGSLSRYRFEAINFLIWLLNLSFIFKIKHHGSSIKQPSSEETGARFSSNS